MRSVCSAYSVVNIKPAEGIPRNSASLRLCVKKKKTQGTSYAILLRQGYGGQVATEVETVLNVPLCG